MSECPGEVGYECSEGIIAKGLCRRCYERQRRRANPERYAEYGRRWREANPDKVSAIHRRHYEKNRPKRLEKNRRFRAANPDYGKQWYAANRDREAWKRTEHDRQRRALEAGVTIIPYTREQFEARMAYYGNRCYLRTLCDGAPYEEADHVIPLAVGGPHVLANLRPVCVSCNRSKATTPLATYLEKVS